MTEFPPSLLLRDRRDTAIVLVTFAPPFFAPVTVKNQIEAFSEDVAIGSLSRFCESLKRIPA